MSDSRSTSAGVLLGARWFRRLVMPALFYIILWAAFSGLTEPLPVVAGLISVILVLIVSGRMAIESASSSTVPLHWWHLPGYLLRLLVDILIANVLVARIILSPGLAGARPCVLRVPAKQKNAVTLMIHANSITLTPGTLSLRLEPGYIFVHSLKGSEPELEQGELDRRVSRLEGRP